MEIWKGVTLLNNNTFYSEKYSEDIIVQTNFGLETPYDDIYLDHHWLSTVLLPVSTKSLPGPVYVSGSKLAQVMLSQSQARLLK